MRITGMATVPANKIVLSVSELQEEDASFFPRYVPLSSLPTLFREWEKVTSQLSELLRTKNLRDTIHGLPAVEFSRKTLHSAGEWQRALCVVSSLFQGYVWQDGEAGVPGKIPSVLAVPMFNVCKELGLPPFGTFAALGLYNWHLKDESKPFSLENICANITLTGTEDESWFYMVSVVIEKEFSPALSAIIAYIKGDNAALLQSTLKVVEEAIKKIHATLNRIPERCTPSAFCSMRHYFAGTKGLQVFQNGLIYEGVAKDPLSFHGISAAQMPSIKAIDAFLGVQHKGTFLETMNEYIPEHHRKLLEFISLNQQSVRSAVLESRDNNMLIKQFNSTVQALVNLRSDHIILVTRYIINQRRGQSTAATLETVGTGGTHFMQLLKSARDRTKALLLQ